MRCFFFTLTVYCSAILSLMPSAMAQMSPADIPNASCAAYRDSANTPAQQELFKAYIHGYANAASPDPRYAPSAGMIEDGIKRVQDWCDRNQKRTFAEAVATAFPLPPASSMPQQGVSDEPTSCRVGPTDAGCSGCSITCTGGKQAKCDHGIGNADGTKCAFEGKCYCK
jgi:hypothetical protein